MYHKSKLLRQLIEIESLSSDRSWYPRVSQLLQQNLSNYPIRTFESRGVQSWLIANQDTSRFKVILNAHLDVVAGEPNQYQLKLVDDRLYGRGTYDMKAAAVVMIETFKQVASQIKYPIALQLVTDEEVGGFDGTKHQLDSGIRSEFVLAGEPTNFNIMYKAKGVLWLKIKYRGDSAHAAYLWEGQNPYWQLNPFLNQLQQHFPTPNQPTDQTTVNLARICTSGQTYNKVPDEIEVWLDVRYTDVDKDTVVNQITSLLPESAEVEVVINEPCYHTSKTDTKLQRLVKACQNNQVDTELKGAYGSSDVRFYSNYQAEGVEFGPVGFGHHTDHEWVSLTSLDKYQRILSDWLLSN